MRKQSQFKRVGNDHQVKDAVEVLRAALSQDKMYYIAWSSNIAMAFKDAAYHYRAKQWKSYLSNLDLHLIGNEAAAAFLDLLCSSPNESRGGVEPSGDL